MTAAVRNAPTETAAPARRAPAEQRLLLHGVTPAEHATLSGALRGRAGLRLTYAGENLEIAAVSAPPARTEWTTDTQTLRLDFVSWRDYDAILHAIDRHHLRTSYDRGSLELMTLSPEHERYKNLLRLLVQALAEEFGIAIANLASTTFRREDMDRGLEPDECWYIRNWPRVRGKKRLDLTVDPPPDLAVEVDITHMAVDRLALYAALGVPEVWRFDGESLRVFVLDAHGQYEERPRSPTFPRVPPDEVARFVCEGIGEDDAAAVRAFRAWVRALA